MTQKLTLAKVKKNARAYYKSRKLTAQHRDQRKRRCVYQDGAYRCAIGASLDDKTLKKIFNDNINDNSIEDLQNLELIDFERDEQDAIEDIQRAHDDWAQASLGLGANSEQAIYHRKLFMERIGLANG